MVMLKSRLDRFMTFLEKSGSDALLVTHLPNIRYLCGFSGSDAMLLATPERCWFLCDSRYTVQARSEVCGADIVETAVKYDSLRQIVMDNRIMRLAFEASHVTVAEYERLSGHLDGRSLSGVDSLLDAVRGCKDQDEIGVLRRNAALASECLQSVLHLVKPGMAESALALALEMEMRRRGAEDRAFDFIVASGERGAMPHGKASEKLLCSGELVTIDFGLVMDGYNSDETVTVSVGRAGDRCREIHGIVKDAHDRAIDAVRPGISCRELDEVARSWIRRHGYEQYFGHGLGHGVGLEIHEKPTLSPRSDDVVEEGMVLTIEPGIYLPGFGGVRIEDMIVVTQDGCELLSRAPKELLEL